MDTYSNRARKHKQTDAENEEEEDEPGLSQVSTSCSKGTRGRRRVVGETMQSFNEFWFKFSASALYPPFAISCKMYFKRVTEIALFQLQIR